MLILLQYCLILVMQSNLICMTQTSQSKPDNGFVDFGFLPSLRQQNMDSDMCKNGMVHCVYPASASSRV